MRRLLVNICFAVVFPTAAMAQMAPTEALDSVVAQVDEDVVLKSELDDAVANIRRQYAGREQQLPPPNVLERQVLDRLVLGRLQVQRAEATGVEVTDTEIDQALGRMAAGNNMSVMQMRDVLARDGVSLTEFRKSIRDELLTQKLRQRVIESRAAVSESEVDMLLASDSLKTGEVHLAHILVALPANANNEEVEKARGKIDGVRKLIEEGKMDFQAAAIRYSDGPQALEGGDLGWRRYDQIPEAFSQTIAGMQKGDVSQPMRALSGFHMVKLLDQRAESQVVITEYNARHIVIDVNELMSDAEAEAKIRTIARQVTEGQDLGKLAREMSDESTTAALGGDMGWFEINAFGSTYAEQLTTLKDQEIGQPFRTERGWHLVQRLGTRQQDRTREFVRNQAKEGLQRRKGEEVYEQFLRQIRAEAYVRNHLQDGGDADDQFMSPEPTVPATEDSAG